MPGQAEWEWYVIADVFRLSEGACRLLGADPAAAPRSLEDVLRFVHVGDRPLLRRVFSRSVAEAPRFAVVHRLPGSDGVPRVLELRGEAELDPRTRDVRVAGSWSVPPGPASGTPEADA